MKTNKITLLIGREHLEKDSYLYTNILSEIKGIQFDVFNDSYSYFGRRVYPFIAKVIPRFIRKNPILRSLYLQIEEQFYSIFLNPNDYQMHVAFQKNPNDISLRVEKLAKRLNKISLNTEITLIGRSAGAIVATMVSLNHPIHKIISLGYPFKHPDFQEEAYRHEHLKHVKTPMLIIQGLQDIYGGKEIEKKYHFNSNTTIVFEDIDHDFELTEENRIRILKNIEQFISDTKN
jgi:predicted esterase